MRLKKLKNKKLKIFFKSIFIFWNRELDKKLTRNKISETDKIN